MNKGDRLQNAETSQECSFLPPNKPLKFVCFFPGQWVEKRHISLSIVLVWVYTFFWAFLPAFGFGTYGPEPYGTSCTINWYRRLHSIVYDTHLNLSRDEQER